jgi:hypothetical protein
MMTQNKRAGASRQPEACPQFGRRSHDRHCAAADHRSATRKGTRLIRAERRQFCAHGPEIAAHSLASVKGANGVVCAAIDRTFDMGNWGKLQLFMNPDVQASEDDIETAVDRQA